MHEQSKLNEAKYFYSQMSANFGEREKFTYNLSAFLSSARSVAQYALKEAKSRNGGEAWYIQYIRESNTLSFFTGKRDVNIHSEPIRPIMNVTARAVVKARIIVSASVVVQDENGNIKQQSSTNTPQLEAKPAQAQEPTQLTVRYLFSDWTGAEDIMTLSQKYIDELQELVQDGIKKGFLTG
jgi:hypothetical protein